MVTILKRFEMVTPEGLEALKSKILEFNKKREWEKYHSPKNIVMDLASEVGELVEPFRWLTEKESYQLDQKIFQNVKDELGDVFRIVVYLADRLGIDPIEAAFQKLDEMDQKYPVDQCFGKALKYNEYKKGEK
jgi:dCTP diphosphatase